MFHFRSRMLQRIAAVLTCFMLAFPLQAAAGHAEEQPSALRMFGDAVIGRPLLVGVTVVGTVIWLGSLPFSLLGGNAGEAANALVIEPARTTFLRCLGCEKPLTNAELSARMPSSGDASE